MEREGSRRTRLGRWWPVLPGAVLGAVGGWWIGSTSTLPGIQGTAGALIASLVVGGLLLLAAGIGVAVGRVARSKPTRDAILLGTGTAAVAAFVTMAAVPVLGLGYAEPAPDTAEGTATGAFTSADVQPGPTAVATCSAPEGAAAVELVDVRDLGELNGGTLLAELYVPEVDGEATVHLLVDAATTQGSPPIWTGRGTYDIEPGGASGTVTFAGLELAEDALMRPGWPPTLAGTITWRCEGWGR